MYADDHQIFASGLSTQGKSGQSCAAEPSRFRPCLRQKLLISLPCLRQETLLSNPNLFCCVVLHTQLTNFYTKIVEIVIQEKLLALQTQTAHRKSSYSLKGFHSQKAQDLENYTLFSGTYPYRPNKGVPPGLLRRTAEAGRTPFTVSTEGFRKLLFGSCSRQRRINFQVKYRNFLR